jgi:N-acetylneuraminic acid mutarotase
MWNTTSRPQQVRSCLLSGNIITLFITILFTINIIGARAQGTWTRKTDYPGVVRINSFGFSIGNKGYMGGGTNNENYQDLWVYDPATDVWTQKADFGGGGRQGASGFAIGNKGYVGCGTSGYDTRNNDFWEYDPATNIWTRKADFGGVERTEGVGFVIGNKGYIGTGVNGQCCTFTKLYDFWEYDPATDKWVRKADFGGGKRQLAVGFSINGKGYIGTGNSDTKDSFSDFWEYDPITDKWTRKADVPGGERVEAFGLSINGKGYIGIGDSSGVNKKDFWEYDPVLNKWEHKADFGGSPRHRAAGFSMPGKGYIGTGAGDNDYLKDFWEYTPSSLKVDAGRDTTIYLNQNQSSNCVTLSAHASLGTTPYKYSWSPGSGTTSSITVCPTKTTTYTVTVTDAEGNTASDQVKVTVIDQRPQISIQDVTVLESQELAFITVRLSKPTKKWILVSYTTQDKTAMHPTDYIGLSGPLFFIPGLNTTAKVIIPIVNDTIKENIEQFQIQLKDPLYAGIKDGIGVVTIIDDDGSTAEITTQPSQPLEQSTSLRLQAFPNISEHAFTLKIEGSDEKSPVSMRVYDMSGRLMEAKTNLNIGQSIQIGGAYRAGTYIVVAEQGAQQVQAKLIKTGH